MDERIDLLRKYNPWKGKGLEIGYERSLYMERIAAYIGNRLVKVLVGQRRSGKSYILRQVAMKLIERGVNAENILFINRELTAFDFLQTYKDLEELIHLYLDSLKPQGRIYLFIDEVQDIEGWEKVINSYSQDYTAEYELFITGSNSQMLSGELSTLLSGRYVEFTVYPLSYQEYASFRKLPLGKQSYMAYMQDGAFPELLNLSGKEIKRNYISALKDTVLLKDVIRRYTIKDVRLLEDLFAYLVNNASNLLSIHNITNYFKSKGRKTSYETVATYIGYIEETFLAHRAERYNIRGKETISGAYKYYMNDLSFKNYLYSGVGYGIGYLLENLVYLELVRGGYQVYVGSIKDKEVDFVAMKNDRTIYIQSTYILADEQTVEREYAPLEAIADNYEKIVVSLDDLSLPLRDGIKHIQAWNLSEIIAQYG
ncbi:MAG: ATP-binding protein [Bacteroides sp.]|nr:ATP-binding protein [Bacteroides sp.]